MSAKARRKINATEKGIIYSRANGVCQLCGKKLKYREMTVDHIRPLSAGGKDNLSNYQCTCLTCNQLKNSMQQNDFYEKITEIFWFQTQRKCGKEFTEKMVMAVLG